MCPRANWAPSGPARRSRLGIGLLPAVLLTACASMVDIRPLATGRADTAAYELMGPELHTLHREAARLCPHGSEILRQAAQQQRPVAEDGRLQRWLNAGSQVLQPLRRSAQMQVLCKEEVPSGIGVTRGALPAALAGASGETASALPPIGPLTVEW